jgi:hypothetical protein
MQLEGLWLHMLKDPFLKLIGKGNEEVWSHFLWELVFTVLGRCPSTG